MVLRGPRKTGVLRRPRLLPRELGSFPVDTHTDTVVGPGRHPSPQTGGTHRWAGRSGRAGATTKDLGGTRHGRVREGRTGTTPLSSRSHRLPPPRVPTGTQIRPSQVSLDDSGPSVPGTGQGWRQVPGGVGGSAPRHFIGPTSHYKPSSPVQQKAGVQVKG